MTAGGQEACLGMLRAPCSWGEKEEPRVRAQVDRDANEMMDARVRARAERRARMRARLGNLGTLIEQRDAAEMRAKCMENRVRAQVEREIAKALSDDADFRLRNRASDAHADTRALARHGILKAWSAWILNSDYETLKDDVQDSPPMRSEAIGSHAVAEVLVAPEASAAITTTRDLLALWRLRLHTSGRAERLGQALFNTVALALPALAERVRGGPNDPFHDPAMIPTMLLLADECIRLSARAGAPETLFVDMFGDPDDRVAVVPVAEPRAVRSLASRAAASRLRSSCGLPPTCKSGDACKGCYDCRPDLRPESNAGRSSGVSNETAAEVAYSPAPEPVSNPADPDWLQDQGPCDDGSAFWSATDALCALLRDYPHTGMRFDWEVWRARVVSLLRLPPERSTGSTKEGK